MLPPPFRAMDPADDLAWLAVADWLEENDQPDRAELVRLTRSLRLERHATDRLRREDRLMELLAAGVEPCAATLTNSIGMEFVYIPSGTFLMGSPEDEEGRSENEGPEHEVTITKAFYLGVYAVTQGEYEAVMGTNPSHFSATGNGWAQARPANNTEHTTTVRLRMVLSLFWIDSPGKLEPPEVGAHSCPRLTSDPLLSE